MSGGLSEHQRGVGSSLAIDNADIDIRESARSVLEGRREARNHARNDALSPRQFEQLLTATYSIDKDRIELECRTLLFLTGRLGMRKGEVAHLDSEWVNWSEGTIDIPKHDTCGKGQHGDEPCGYCRNRAKARTETNNISVDDAERAIQQVIDESTARQLSDAELRGEAVALQSEVNIGLDDALELQWQPKTLKSARRIPFDFDVRVEMQIERFFERFDGWEASAATVNRRVSRVAELSNVEANVYPHSLRATAASYHASRDLSVHSLMSIMGWADPSTARAYVASNADSAAKELRSKHR